MPKRYVLIMSDSELSDSDRMDLAVVLESRYGKATVIPVDGNCRAVIVKTTGKSAPLIRRDCEQLRVGGAHLTTVLSSGSIGKLKSRALGSDAQA